MQFHHLLRCTLLAALGIFSLTACDVETYRDAAGGFGGNSPPVPPPPPPPPGGFGPTFSEIQANVLTPDCTGSSCHAGGAPAAGLNLEVANSYAELVGVASSQNSGIERVNPGDPGNSYLIQKLEGTAGGQQMPAGAAPLAQSEIDVIRQWIIDGAIDDRLVPPAAPIRVTSLSPTPGAALVAAPTQIVAGFDRALDTSTVNANTFTLTGSGGDGLFGNDNDVAVIAFSVSVPGGNPQTAVFNLSGVVLADDSYRVSLLGNGASIIVDLDANALDGEFSGSFPSGNGTAGGDFQAMFTLATPVVIGPTLEQIQAVVFTPMCSSCHSGGTPSANLNLSNADTSYAQLVGVVSTQEAPILRVAANDPDNSYLIHKLEGNNTVGGRMPPSEQLDPATIGHIRQWINDGALR